MAERSSCVKVITKCQSCSRKIKRCNSFKDNSYCDDCEETITPCKYIDVNILSGLVRDRKNKFLFVGEGNFSFTVAFNAYRQNLWYDEEIIRTRFEEQCFWCYKYSPCLIVKILIILHQSSITDIAIERLCGLIRTYQVMAPELESVVQCLDASSLESERVFDHLTDLNILNIRSCQANYPIIIKHLFKSIREVNRANEYLLESIRKVKAKPCTDLQYNRDMGEAEAAIKDLLESYSKVEKATKKFSDGESSWRDIVPNEFIGKYKELKEDIENQHIESLITVDHMEQDVQRLIRPQIDIISSRYEGEPYKKTICEVKEAMCSGSDGYICPSDEDIVDILRAVDCTNIRQMCGIDACSIPPEIARWSNLVWFQCPWTEWHAIPDLIRAFLRSASDNCAPGTFVCVVHTKEALFSKSCPLFSNYA